MLIATSGIVQRTSADQAKAAETVYNLLATTSTVKSDSTKPDATSYSLLLKARAKAGDAQGIEQVLEEANKNGVVLDKQEVLLQSMIGYGRAGDKEKAFKLLDEYTELLHPHEYHGKNPDGTVAISRTQAKKMAREAENAKWLEWAEGRAQKLDIASAVKDIPFPLGPKRKPPLPADAPRSLVVKRKNAKKQMTKADHGAILDAHNALLKAMARSFDREGAEALLAKMKEHGPLPTNTSYSSVMIVAAHYGDLARCQELYKEAVEKQSLKESRVLMNHVLFAALAAGDLTAAAKIVETMQSKFNSPDTTTLKLMLDLYVKSGNAGSAWATAATLLGVQGGKKVDVFDIGAKLATVTEVLEGGDMVQTWDAYASQIELPVEKVTLYGMGVVGYARKGDAEMVNNLTQAFENVLEESVETKGSTTSTALVYRAAIDGLLKNGKVLDAGILFESLRKTGNAQQYPETFSKLIAALSGAELEEKDVLVQGLVDLMLEEGVQGETGVLEVVSKVFGKESNVSQQYAKTL
jgi:hypothetical protein